ncbi:MAG TPA: ABC transporter permease [Puia sp.]|uniref:ABC transporter permease n=1 Tax=Puia sp. TaxID=2045100 RepID=UPI002C8FE503|nr:ABC transporter permease [Puia sp.]HVU94533.1 ABC transporter permease [Puia sp.]
MFRNYWKVAVRSLLKRKGFTLINILGLATGMAVCLLIVLFVRHELSFDRWEVNGDRVYRVVLERKYPGRLTSYAIIPFSIGPAIRKEFPEVEEQTGFGDFTGTNTMLVRIGDQRFEERNVLVADSTFFRVFPMRLLEGDVASALDKPGMAVLTESTAKRLYGSPAAAIGKEFETDRQQRFRVSGVCPGLPENSHLRLNILLSVTSFPFARNTNYTGFSTYTYLLLKPNASAAGLEAQLPQVVKKYVSGEIARNFGMTYEQFIAAGNGYHYYLQPVRNIHLDSDLEAELKPNGSRRAVAIFGIIAVFILGIAGINFINLSTARSVERAKEVGVRKTFGSGQQSLVWQFLLESVLVSVLGILLAVGLVAVALPFFNRLSGEAFSLGMLLTPVTIPVLLAFGIGVGLVAGLYPAFVLSSFQPIKVLKGKFQSNAYGVALRNGLVIFQFAISIVLMICTIVVNRQMGFMLGDKLGFVKDHILEIERTDLVDSKTFAFRNELAGIAGVEKIGGVSSMPGEGNFFGVAWQPVGSKESMTGRGIVADASFAETLGLTMKEGRFFNKSFPTDSLAVVLNEKAVAALGLKEPVIGTRLTTTSEFLNPKPDSFYTYTVIGVVRDFHYQSLHQAINPLVFTSASKFGDVTGVTAVRIRGDAFAPAIAAIEQKWRQFVPDHPFHYTFLDQTLAAQYRPEQTLQRIFTVFSALAIFIACIGLLGLAAYATQQRIREICIRKVLGARVGTIVGLLSRDFVKLVTISALVAFPLAYWAMHSWLQGFAYRVGLSWWIFVLAWGLSLGITLLTIGFQALRAAGINPVTILRSE